MNKNLTILHVEDDPSDILLIERAFRKAEFSGKIVVVNDGEQAISYLNGQEIYGDRKNYPLTGFESAA